MYLKYDLAAKKCPHEGGSIPYLLNVGARTSILFFYKNIFCFRFSRSLKAIKRRWARFGLPFPVVIINKMIIVNKLRLCEGRHLPVLIWLCVVFSSTWFGEVSQNFHNLWNLSSRSFKSRKKEGVTKAVFSLLAILCFLPLSQIWCYDFFYQQALGRAQICLTIQQIWTSPRFITN